MEQSILMTKDSHTSTRHVPVLLNEVCEYLKVSEGGTFFDGTFGGGGHAKAILNANEKNIVIACDRDIRALERGKAIADTFEDRLTLHHSRFSNIESLVEPNSLSGVLVDLGMSTDQLFEKRGFSFSEDAPLDMRMDESDSSTAAEILSEMNEREIATLLKKGGLRAGANQVARALSIKKPYGSTKEFAAVVTPILRPHFSEKDTHPSTVVFQALRVAVNDEFGEIKTFIESLPNCMSEGGRAALISFHSLEDQIITKAFRGWTGDTTPPSLPPFSTEPAKGVLLTKKAVTPTDDEIARNPASRSARLRVFEFRRVH